MGKGVVQSSPDRVRRVQTQQGRALPTNRLTACRQHQHATAVAHGTEIRENVQDITARQTQFDISPTVS
jgi:hypothetical protein